jgi:hypothetical protein
MLHALTPIAEIEAAGFSELHVHCSCGAGRIGVLRFADIRRRHHVHGSARLPDLQRRMRCRECGERPRELEPWTEKRTIGGNPTMVYPREPRPN